MTTLYKMPGFPRSAPIYATPGASVSVDALYQPISRVAGAAFRLSRFCHRATAELRLLPYRGSHLGVLPLLPTAEEMALMDREWRNRTIICGASADALTYVAKVAPERQSPLLENEHSMLRLLAETTRSFEVASPLLSARQDGVHVFVQSAVHGRPLSRSFEGQLDLGLQLCVELATLNLTHGDLAPWNIVASADSIAIVDWELGRDHHRIGWDLCHFLDAIGHSHRLPETFLRDALGEDRIVGPYLRASGATSGELLVAARRYARHIMEKVGKRVGRRRHAQLSLVLETPD